MGTKGDKQTAASATTAEALVEALQPLGEVTTKKMFGGHGIFAAGTMFALVDSSGRAFLRAGDANRAALEAAGAEQHGRMPYLSLPDTVRADSEALLAWAGDALAVARAAKKA